MSRERHEPGWGASASKSIKISPTPDPSPPLAALAEGGESDDEGSSASLRNSQNFTDGGRSASAVAVNVSIGL